jgi:hypothetical protein
VVLIANEVRSLSVQQRFLELFGAQFVLKTVPASKQHSMFQHPAILLYLCKRRKEGKAGGKQGEEAEEGQEGEEGEGEAGPGPSEQADSRSGGGGGTGDSLAKGLQRLQVGDAGGRAGQGEEKEEEAGGDSGGSGADGANVDWQSRRQGVMAARSLAGVQVPGAGGGGDSSSWGVKGSGQSR